MTIFLHVAARSDEVTDGGDTVALCGKHLVHADRFKKRYFVCGKCAKLTLKEYQELHADYIKLADQLVNMGQRLDAIQKLCDPAVKYDDFLYDLIDANSKRGD